MNVAHLWLGAAVLTLTACQSQTPQSAHIAADHAEKNSLKADAPQQLRPGADATQNAAVKLDTRHLPNAYRIHAKVISGGQPAGDEGFRELAALGVKTLISVDGAKPDVETAKKYGLRYVHLPHGYDGVPSARGWELAKAVRDLPGPVYIHCHHGKHRSPVAASVACVTAGLIAPSLAERVLQTAGTSQGYRGLYASARSAKPLDERLLDELNVDFQETAEIPPMAESMISIEHTHDHLKALAAVDWRSLPEHPDIEPAQEALLLREHFTELLRSEAARKETEAFRALLHQSQRAARELEAALQAGNSQQAQQAFARINNGCSSCHRDFRDVPLSEKKFKE